MTTRVFVVLFDRLEAKNELIVKQVANQKSQYCLSHVKERIEIVAFERLKSKDNLIKY